jgi:glucosamine-6-phosphate deaminase
MNPYALEFRQFSRLKPWRFTRVDDVGTLNQRIAEEVTASLNKAMAEGRSLLVICPVGPLDYSYWAELMNQRQTDGACLITISMDEYLDENDHWIEEDHPLSFRRFLRENFFNRLRGRARIPQENIHFPDPFAPNESTALIEAHGGADLCYGGMGLTGHLAFNDPPESDSPQGDEEICNSRTRVVTICRESQAQMCMGGTDGNWDIIPKRAVTLGMYEILLSKKIHLTYMRSWHAGVVRRALFGPVSGSCPGSFVQTHKNVEVTLTELAARVPLIHVAQRIAQ